jgi:hypothetical protein
MVDTDIDVRITDVPLNVRQPDVAVSRGVPDSERLYSRSTPAGSRWKTRSHSTCGSVN